jgi:hypothetical protein
MATKKDVFNAFYEGVCVALFADHQFSLCNSLEIDKQEFSKFLDEHPEYEELRFYCSE